jgi:hypothetical protein
MSVYDPIERVIDWQLACIWGGSIEHVNPENRIIDAIDLSRIIDTDLQYRLIGYTVRDMELVKTGKKSSISSKLRTKIQKTVTYLYIGEHHENKRNHSRMAFMAQDRPKSLSKVL